MFFLKCSYQNKRVTVTESRNENEEIMISYSQLRKSKQEVCDDLSLRVVNILPKVSSLPSLLAKKTL